MVDILFQNVDDADGTLAIRLHPGNGTDKTIGWYGPVSFLFFAKLIFWSC